MSNLIIKVCGITLPEQAHDIAQAGADWIGLNFWPKSSRYLELDQAREVAAAIPGPVKRVGVFVDADPETIVERITSCELDFIQLHGAESPEELSRYPVPAFKALPVDNREDLQQVAPYLTNGNTTFLLDAKHPVLPGGTGQQVATYLSKEACRMGNCIVAGGLHPGNVEQLVLEAVPFGVDVASGVESAPGIKDIQAVCDFVNAARRGHKSAKLRHGE